MNTKEEKINDVLVCTVEGDITMANSPALRKIFEDIIKRNEKKVLIDFSSVSFIESSGLATLIEMYQRLKKIEGSLRFCSMTQKVKNVFELTRLNTLFALFDTREAALKDF